MHTEIKADAAAEATDALKFFSWAYEEGDSMAKDLDYVPLPNEVVGLVKKTWATSIKSQGKPVWAGK